jgi:hypothetical protein
MILWRLTKLEKTPKVILIDHTGLVEYVQRIERFHTSFGNLYFNILIACLKRLLISPDDILIIAVSDTISWRSSCEVLNRTNRRTYPPSTSDYSKMLTMLHNYSPFYIIKQSSLDSEDIITCATNYYKDNKTIIISSREIFKQLVINPNIRIFSPVAKRFLEIKNPTKELHNFILKNTKSFVGSEKLNEQAYEEASEKYNLLNLSWSFNSILQPIFDNIDKKEYNIENLSPYYRKNILSIYNSFTEPKKKKNRKHETLTLL